MKCNFDTGITNTLHFPITSGDRLLEVAGNLETRFGEIARLSLLAPAGGAPGGSVNTAEVVFFDIRDAAKAYKALGKGCCVPAAQRGDRTAKCGSMALSPEEKKLILSILPCAEETGVHLYEFYDIRDAARFRELTSVNGFPVYRENRDAISSHSRGATHRTGSSNIAASAEVWLKYLPSAICTWANMDAILEQAGLASHVTYFDFLPREGNDKGKGQGKGQGNGQGKGHGRGHSKGQLYGDALLTVDISALKSCIAHFHGRSWGLKVPVSTTVVGLCTPVAKELGLVSPWGAQDTPETLRDLKKNAPPAGCLPLPPGVWFQPGPKNALPAPGDTLLAAVNGHAVERRPLSVVDTSLGLNAPPRLQKPPGLNSLVGLHDSTSLGMSPKWRYQAPPGMQRPPGYFVVKEVLTDGSTESGWSAPDDDDEDYRVMLAERVRALL